MPSYTGHFDLVVDEGVGDPVSSTFSLSVNSLLFIVRLNRRMKQKTAKRHTRWIGGQVKERKKKKPIILSFIRRHISVVPNREHLRLWITFLVSSNATSVLVFVFSCLPVHGLASPLTSDMRVTRALQ